MTWTRGAHTLKVGGVYVRHRFNGFSAFPTRGDFSFNGQFTRQLNTTTTATAIPSDAGIGPAAPAFTVPRRMDRVRTAARARSGAQAMQSARAQILAGFADVAMVIGADTSIVSPDTWVWTARAAMAS